MKLTTDLLVDAAEDLNSVLKLNPPIVTEFSSNLKGAALKAVEDKFLTQVKSDLLECSSLIDENDVVKASTVDVLETIGAEGIRTKVKCVTSPEEVKAPPEPEKKGPPATERKPPSTKPAPKAVEKKEEKKEVNQVKTKKAQPKKAPVAPKKAAPKVTAETARVEDQYGFSKGSYSSDAIKMLASGKLVKDVRKKFSMLSFSKLLKTLEKNGFKMKETKEGIPSIVKK